MNKKVLLLLQPNLHCGSPGKKMWKETPERDIRVRDIWGSWQWQPLPWFCSFCPSSLGPALEHLSSVSLTEGTLGQLSSFSDPTSGQPSLVQHLPTRERVILGVSLWNYSPSLFLILLVSFTLSLLCLYVSRWPNPFRKGKFGCTKWKSQGAPWSPIRRITAFSKADIRCIWGQKPPTNRRKEETLLRCGFCHTHSSRFFPPTRASC